MILTKTFLLAKKNGFDESDKSQTTLQKWFREKHNIEINVHRVPVIDNEITYVCKIKNFKNYWSDWIFINRSKIDEPINHFETYELALEAGLQESFKII